VIGEGGFIGEISLYDLLPDDAYYIPADVELTDFHVHSLRRGLGWGHILMAAALRYADRYGWAVFLRAVPYGSTPAELTKLLKFYRSYGFRQVRRGDKRELIRRALQK
jgi:GNAT superfamily N-acetyltransferase